MIPVGAVLAAECRVARVLGQGGIGAVVQPMHMQPHQPVAVKFLLPEISAGDSAGDADCTFAGG